MSRARGPGKRKYQRNQTYAEYLHQPENLWNFLEPRQRQPGNPVFRLLVAICTFYLFNFLTVFRGTLGRGSWATQELPQVTTYSRKCEPSVTAPHSTKPSGDAENLFYPKCVFCGSSDLGAPVSPPPPPPHVWQRHCSLSMPLPGGHTPWRLPVKCRSQARTHHESTVVSSVFRCFGSVCVNVAEC